MMAAKKPRGVREIPSYVLDATGRNESPTMTEILSKGSPAEVREVLGGQGALMQAGAPLPAPVAEWLGAALEAIGRGEDANLALRVAQAARGRPPTGVRKRAAIEHQIADLVRQGVSRKDAAGIVERYRIAMRHSDDPDALWGKTEDDQAMAAERAGKRLRRGSQGTK
jgi:hypothetical protein